MWKLYEIQCFLFRKLHWNTVTPPPHPTPIRFWLLCAITAELNGGDRDSVISKTLSFWPFSEKVCALLPVIYFQCGQGPGQPSGCWSAAKDHLCLLPGSWTRCPVGAAGRDAQRNVGKGMKELLEHQRRDHTPQQT